METSYENNFQEFRVLKLRARSTGVSAATLLRFKDRAFRNHLIALYGDGSALTELVEYVAAFYAVEVTAQQLRKILQGSNREAWTIASNSYKQHRKVMKQEHINSASGV